MARTVGNEVVLLDVESGRYFGLNDVGAAVWNHLADDCSLSDLVEAVVAAFDVEDDQAASDVNALMRDLIDAGLVTE